MSVCDLCTHASRLPPGVPFRRPGRKSQYGCHLSQFPGTFPVLWVVKSLKIWFATPDIPGFANTYKYDISVNAYEHSDFPTVRGDIYRSRTSIIQRLTGRNRRGRGRLWIINYEAWLETGKEEELMCKQN